MSPQVLLRFFCSLTLCCLCAALLACRMNDEPAATDSLVPPIAAPATKPEPVTSTTRPALNTQKWMIDGVEREALVAMPNASLVAPTGSPILFVFHGRGGAARQVRRSYDIESLWPEAIVVYPQGLKTPGRIMDLEGKKTGWQAYADVVDNRDLRFFDAMLASMLTDAHGDANRVYSTGHSNGGGFTYLLWSQRHDVLAAVAPSAAAANAQTLTKPLPAMHVGGRNDSVVKFALQEATMKAVRERNRCADEGTSVGAHGTLYASSVNAPVLVWITDGTHAFDKSCVKPMVDFFNAHSRPVPTPAPTPALPTLR